MSLSLSLSTRNRPALVAETLGRLAANISLSDTKIVVCVDADDPKSAEAITRTPEYRDSRLILSVKEREDSLGEKWERVRTEAPADLYLPCCDDAAILTPGFDRIMLDVYSRFPDGIGAVYSPMANASFPAYTAISANLAEHMGFIFPPFFGFWFSDHWSDDVCRMIGRIAYAHIDVDQKQQPGTQEMRELGFWTTFFDVMAVMRRKQARDIIDSEAFLEPEWRKEILRTSYPLVEYRSRWINDNVRMLERQMKCLDAASGGERYARIKLKAKQLVQEWLPAIRAADGIVEQAEAAE